jgi:hypothetical protein
MPKTAAEPSKMKIAVDWHNTLEVRGQVPEANLVALERLINSGYQVSILSFIGVDSHDRRQEFYRQALALRCAGKLERVADCTKKTGPEGKVLGNFKKWGIQVCFDDNKEVLQEAMANRIAAYAITTRYENHQWFFDEGFRPARTFADAVQEFLHQQNR